MGDAMNQMGQIMSLDLIASDLVFLLVFFFLYQAYFLNVERFSSQTQSREMQHQSQEHAYLLVNSPGYPADWNSAGVIIPGLALEPGVIDSVKLSSLRSMTISDYNSVRSLMDLNAYEFRIDIDSNNNALDTNFGKDSNGYAQIFANERIVTIGGDYAVFRLSLFR